MKKKIKAHSAVIKGDLVIIERINIQLTLKTITFFFVAGFLMSLIIFFVYQVSVSNEEIFLLIGFFICIFLIGFTFPSNKEVYQIPKNDLILIKKHFFTFYEKVTVIFDDEKNKLDFLK